MDLISGILAIVIVLLIAYFLGIFKGAPFLPTDKQTLARMIEAAQIKPGDKVADLGSGDGRILIAAAKLGAEAHGFEINPLLILISNYRIRKAGVSNLAFVHWKSFWKADLSSFNTIMLFGITNIMQNLGKKLEAELKPDSKIISNTFRFPQWEPEKINNVFVYRIKK